MPVRDRPHPVIPDYEVLRKIGGGAYGEVWLARGVTGALRAVKVVWREDFEDDRGFEREFEGILKFEPLSRDHPGLVNILHVGRSPNGAFYYYVMELGDDVSSGRDINPVEYQPRTLRGDQPQAPVERWETGECIEVGLRLAEALGHLHENGLAHRDVKPSNIIFVNGKAKLADIGLVAARGQRTFVGTEGFVPPEGPGSSQADIYSLGKVLYEMATGKDRMDFPELPEDMPAGRDRKRWLELNRVICDICEPRVSKRRITTGTELVEALKRIHKGKSGLPAMAGIWLVTASLALFSCWAGWQLVKDSQWLKNLPLAHSDPPPAVGLLRVFSTPEGADVVDSNGVTIGTTPTSTLTAQVGEDVSFTLRKNGFRPLVIRGKVTLSAVSEPMVLSGQMKIFAPPQTGEAWTDHLGNRYLPVGNQHIRSGYVTRAEWNQFRKETGAKNDITEFTSFSENGQPVEIALTTAQAAGAFCRWLRTGGIRDGYLTENHAASPLIDEDFDPSGLSASAQQAKLRPFRVMVRRILSSRLLVTSDPPGAEVYLNGGMAGTTHTPLEITDIKPGKVKLQLVLEGYKPLSKSITLEEGELLEQSLVLEKNEGVVFGHPWQNGIKMRFVPVGRDLMASIWETRVSDYALFVSETGHPPPPPPSFQQEPDHPVVNVSRDDARAFCEWLTRRERKDERISLAHEYRLPTDLEWSLMAGLVEEEGISPGWRDARKQPVYPWGANWPDEEKPGNFADMTAALSPGVPEERTIPGYDDGFAYTAPVGSFPPNDLGIYDLSGNVQEWVEDEYSKLGTNVLGVLRGGGWNTYQTENLYTGSRNAIPPGYRDEFYGFRVVLAKINPKSD